MVERIACPADLAFQVLHQGLVNRTLILNLFSVVAILCTEVSVDFLPHCPTQRLLLSLQSANFGHWWQFGVTKHLIAIPNTIRSLPILYSRECDWQVILVFVFLHWRFGFSPTTSAPFFLLILILLNTDFVIVFHTLRVCLFLWYFFLDNTFQCLNPAPWQTIISV